MPNPLFGDTTSELLQNGDGSDLDTIYGDLGDDTILGLAEADLLAGEGGQDRVFGGEGNDELDGGNQNDRLWGGDGNDAIDAGWGSDDIYGGRGDDTIIGSVGNDLIYGGKGHDQIAVFTSSVVDDDTIFGGGGNDRAVFLPVSGGSFDGGTGRDRLILVWADAIFGNVGDVMVDMLAATPHAFGTGGGGFVDPAITFTNVEDLTADLDAGNDTVYAAGGDDEAFLYQGANVADMGGGDDNVSYIVGEANTLEGGTGQDTLSADSCGCFAFTFDASGVTATDAYASVLTGFEQFDVFGSFYADTITLGAGDDTATGSSGDDTITGGGGADNLAGDRGKDVIDGGDGNDVLRGGTHDDTLYGGADDDRLSGNRGRDLLFGGAGADTLISGKGDDTLWGDGDSDVFRFNTLPDAGGLGDAIGDFVTAEDRIEVKQAILTGSPATGQVASGDLAFGTAADADAQFVYVLDGGLGLLYWDTDGTGTGEAELLVKLLGAPVLAAEDIWII